MSNLLLVKWKEAKFNWERQQEKRWAYKKWSDFYNKRSLLFNKENVEKSIEPKKTKVLVTPKKHHIPRRMMYIPPKV